MSLDRARNPQDCSRASSWKLLKFDNIMYVSFLEVIVSMLS